jgi:hypothetical protein
LKSIFGQNVVYLLTLLVAISGISKNFLSGAPENHYYNLTISIFKISENAYQLYIGRV